MKNTSPILTIFTLLVLIGIFLPGSYHSGILNAQDDNSAEIARLEIEGLNGPVSIYRDEWGVPAVRAETDHDLFVGYGYIVAKDRLWQIDGSRRLACGRIAEVAGQAQLHWDIYHRNMRLGPTADGSVELLDPVTREYLQAFADGVNAYIESHRDNLPFEFLLMNYEPEPWTVADSLAITRLVAVWLAADLWDEDMYGTLIDDLGEDTASKLFPPVPETEPNYIYRTLTGNVDRDSFAREAGSNERSEHYTSGPECPGGSAIYSIREGLVSEWFEPLARIASTGHLDASNIWAVDGSMTASGEPILAMDPHLNYFAPSILYEVILDGDKIHCWGASFPGMPFLPFGANENIAWGASNFPADCQDMFIEKLNPSNSMQYEYDGEWKDFITTIESISYKDSSGQVQTYNLNLYSSIHGPLIMNGLDTSAALKWTGIEPGDDVTGFRLAMTASNIEEFYEAFRGYQSPAQNLCMIEKGRNGRVAQILIGDIPVRNGYDGSRPVDGSDSSRDWTGYIPYDDLPHRIDPPEGYVAHANNLPLNAINEDGSRPLGTSFSTNHRIDRIIELLNSRPDGLAFEDMREFQMDDLDISARIFIPKLLEACGAREDVLDAGLNEYARLLEGWDYCLSRDSIEATIYQIWLLKLIQSCTNNKIGSDQGAYISYEDRWIQVLEDYVNGESKLSWLEGESGDEIQKRLTDSLDGAIQELESSLGSDSSLWQWGEVNQAVFPHPSGDENIVGAGSHPWGGGRYTVRVGHYSPFTGPPFINDFGTVFRAVVASEGGVWRIGSVLPPGEEGAVFGPHGSDQMDLWLNGELKDVPFDSYGSETEAGLVLEPGQE
jgi:penicillin amidase